MEKHPYLLRLQFLGFRYSGWQHQPRVKTVEGMLRKTLRFVLPGRKVKLLGAGRTDARVSAGDFAVQLWLYGEPLDSGTAFLEALNRNLPPDIVVRDVRKVPADFNVIRDSTRKTYRYYFTFGPRPHPFCAPFFGYFPEPLDVSLMQEGAALFRGRHDFSGFIARPGEETRRIRTIATCRLEENQGFTASFFPERSYFLEVSGEGFGRYQVRIMMGVLASLGRGTLSLDQLRASLREGSPPGLEGIAPSSGLQLVEVAFAGLEG